MQNPLRRPRANKPNANNRDLEHNRKSNDGVLNKGARGHLVAMSGEFVGTVMFLYFAFAATQIANTIGPVPSINQLLFISLGFGFSLLVTAWVFYRISGGLFNPAVRSCGRPPSLQHLLIVVYRSRLVWSSPALFHLSGVSSSSLPNYWVAWWQPDWYPACSRVLWRLKRR